MKRISALLLATVIAAPLLAQSGAARAAATPSAPGMNEPAKQQAKQKLQHLHGKHANHARHIRHAEKRSPA